MWLRESCNPDEELRRIEERKVKIGGKGKPDAANAKLDTLAEQLRTSVTLKPDDAKNLEKIVKKTRKTKSVQKNRGRAQIDEVD